MAHQSPFVVHVGDLLRSAKSSRPLRIVTPVDWAVELSKVLPEPPVEVDLVLAAASGGVVVRGSIDAAVEHTCPRCLEARVVPITVSINQIGERKGGDDGYEIVGDQLDIEPMLRDEVLLSLPILPFCEPACSGLVRDSQSDLNVPTPGPTGRSESPFAVLQDLFDPGD
jgi:uncharacterized protein